MTDQKWSLIVFEVFFGFIISRNKQTSVKTWRASIKPNFRSVSTGGIWPKE